MADGDVDDSVPESEAGADPGRPGDGGTSASGCRIADAEAPTGTSAASGSDGLSAEFSGANFDFVGSTRGAANALIGRTIGGVHIEGRVADGGMGRVYTGRQVKTGRRVALKLVKPEHVSPRSLRRFEFEAQVLGVLEHRGIVRVLHADTAEVDGSPQPFIVMDFVPRALRLDDYGKQAQPDERAWMRLFHEICSAVAAAHARGVIHRDLKPGNILVTAEGQPRIIDFGVALVRDADVSSGQPTEDGTLGTPRYMSPEQARGGSEDIDVMSDVYSLGVVMYEALAGRMPYEIKAVTDAARIINDVTPEPLASARPDLGRDVCTIVMKCLAKERTDRYSTAAELAADIGRYLCDEAIVAAAPSAYDSVRRFCRRHRTLALSAASILATLLIALGVVSFFFVESERRRDEMQVALGALRNERQLGDRLVDIVVRAIGGARPGSAAETVVRRDQLIQAAGEVVSASSRGDRAREVVVKARFLRAIGDALLSIGRPVEARALFRQVVGLADAVPGAVPDEEQSLSLGRLAHAALECGDFQEAIDAGERVTAAARGQDSMPSQAAVSCQALALMSLGRVDEAAVIYGAIESRFGERMPPMHPDRAVMLTNHGEILRRRGKPGDLAAAEAKHRAAVGIWDRQPTHDDPREGVTLNNLGEVVRLAGDLEAAAACHERALELHRATLPPGHFLISTGLSKLAEVHRLSGRHAEAEGLLAEALAIRENANLGDHPEAALLHWRLAQVLDASGRSLKAAGARRRCLEIRRDRLGDDHPDTLAAAKACGVMAVMSGEYRVGGDAAGRFTLHQFEEEVVHGN